MEFVLIATCVGEDKKVRLFGVTFLKLISDTEFHFSLARKETFFDKKFLYMHMKNKNE